MGASDLFGDARPEVAAEMQILMAFMTAADPRAELTVYGQQPLLHDPNTVRLMARLVDQATQQGKHGTAQVLREKRARLIQLQAGL